MAGSRSAAVVVGGGLGGLLSGAYLARAGYEVTVWEKLGFYGGKFTSLAIDGFQVPTGALHTLPGGRHGRIAAACAAVGVPLELHEARPAFVVRRGSERYALTRNPLQPGTFWSLLEPGPRRRVAAAIGALLATPLVPDVTFERWLRLCGVPDEVRAVLDRVVSYSLGVPICEASARDVGYGMWAQRWRSEAVVRGGVRAVCDGLAAVIREHGGRIRRGRSIQAITVEGGRARGVVTDRGEAQQAEVVVHSAGLPAARQLLGPDYPPSLAALEARAVPAWGASFSVRSREPLVPHPGIEVPLDAADLAGYVQVSLAAPELAPEGWHYLLAYQVLDRGADPAPRLRAAQAQLRRLFPGLADDAVFNLNVYRGEWPAARLGQSQAHHGAARCPLRCPGIRRLYFVSHDSAGYGFAAEVIGDAVQHLVPAVTADA